MSNELSNFGDSASASVTRGAQHDETLGIQGWYDVKCYDSEGNLKWEDKAPNLVTAVGKQALFDYFFGATGTAGGTASGANYLGLCGGTATYAYNDTMLSHTWTEVGGTTAPNYTGNRQSINWTAASSNTTASPSNLTTKTGGAITFSIVTTGGTVNGCFIVGGSGALATKDNTGGILYSCGNFTGGSKTVAPGDSLAVTYSTTATG
jgi:hypothetical protein